MGLWSCLVGVVSQHGIAAWLVLPTPHVPGGSFCRPARAEWRLVIPIFWQRHIFVRLSNCAAVVIGVTWWRSGVCDLWRGGCFPYFVWVTYAAALHATICRLNV